MNPKLEKLRVEQERVQRELEQAQHRQQALQYIVRFGLADFRCIQNEICGK